MKKGVFTLVLSVILSGLTAYAVVKSSDKEDAGTAKTAYNSEGQVVKTVNLSLSDYPDFTYAAENAVEAVVYVKVTIKTQQQRYQMVDPFFRFFFGDEGNGQPRERVQQGSGSGVIIRPDGYIVTNNHVVASASSIEVTLNNNKTYEAKVIGTDPATDVALIKIEADNLPAIDFADSDKLRLGEWVLAIGSPLGEELRSTITAGIVSAKGRSMPNYDGEFKIESFIQTDAAVNPGNSGGALVNKEGLLVGINTAIISTTGSYSGYSFAVPSNIVRKIVSDLIDFGSVKRAQLGISMLNLDTVANNEDVKKELGIAGKDLKLSSLKGVYIGEVVKGGAADKAGVKKGDILVSIDSVEVKNSAAVQERVNSYHPGDKATLEVLRDGKSLSLKVEFQGTSAPTGTVAQDGTVAFYGAKLQAASKEKLASLGLKNGVEIVSAGSGKLSEAGAKVGMVIVFANDQSVTKPQDVVEIARKCKRSIFLEGRCETGTDFYIGLRKEE